MPKIYMVNSVQIVRKLTRKSKQELQDLVAIGQQFHHAPPKQSMLDMVCTLYGFCVCHQHWDNAKVAQQQTLHALYSTFDADGTIEVKLQPEFK